LSARRDVGRVAEDILGFAAAVGDDGWAGMDPDADVKNRPPP
jgi:hypothetical protein